mgnify:CR=1 FL=1
MRGETRHVFRSGGENGPPMHAMKCLAALGKGAANLH